MANSLLDGTLRSKFLDFLDEDISADDLEAWLTSQFWDEGIYSQLASEANTILKRRADMTDDELAVAITRLLVEDAYRGGL